MTQTLLSPADQTMLMKALQTRSPEVVQARMANALLLLAEGLSVEDVAGLLYVSEEVVAGWHKIFCQPPRSSGGVSIHREVVLP